MTAPRSDARWEVLVDRLVTEGDLSTSERGELRQLREDEPSRVAEIAALEELRSLGSARPDRDRSRSIVDEALAALEEIDGGSQGSAPPTGQLPVSQETLPPRRAWSVGRIVGIVAAVVLVSGLGAWWTMGSGTDPVGLRLAEVSGDLRVTPAPGSSRSGELGTGSVLEVDAGRSCVDVGETIAVCMGPGTAVRVVSLEAHTILEVLRGRAVAQLEPQAQGRSFTLQAGGIPVTAVGTAFSVEHQPERSLVRAAVVEGTVSVSASGASVLVDAGHAAEVEAGTVSVQAMQAPDVGRVWALLRGEPPAASSVAGDRPAVAPHHQTVDSKVDAVAPDGAPPPGGKTPVAPHPQPPRGPSAEHMLKSALAKLDAGDERAAAAAYRRLIGAHPRTPQARTARISLGELYLHQLGDPKRAEIQFRLYLRRGGGPLALQARYGRIQALSRLGRDGDESEAIREFLRRHPKSGYVNGLRRRLRALE